MTFDKWYMITRNTKLSRMLSLLEGNVVNNDDVNNTNMEEPDTNEKKIEVDSKKLYDVQLHPLLKQGSSDDAILSTMFFISREMFFPR